MLRMSYRLFEDDDIIFWHCNNSDFDYLCMKDDWTWICVSKLYDGAYDQYDVFISRKLLTS